MPDTKEKTGHVDHNETVGAAHNLADKTKINRRLIGSSIISYLAAFNYGFNSAIISATITSPAFFEYFPFLATSSNATNLVGAIVCMTNAGGAIGIPCIAVIADRFGRKAGFLACALFTILGAGLATGARTYGMILAGRALTCVGAWGGVMSAISYVQEVCPTFARGKFGSKIGPCINLGYCTAAWVQVGFFYWNDSLNWRIPLLLGIIPSIGILGMLLWVPESPRWLVADGQEARALEVFKSLHGDPVNDPEFILAREEHYQVARQVALDKTLVSSWVSMFTRYRNRTLAAMLICFVNQMTGAQVVTNYGPTIYAQAGLSSGTALITLMPFITGVIFASFWARMVDIMGRKNLLCYGVVATCLCFTLITALYAVYVDHSIDVDNVQAGQNALIFSFFFFVVFYEMSEPSMFTYIGEIFGSHVRNKGIALGLVSLTVTAAWLTMAFPVGVSHIGWKFYLVLIGCMAVGALLQFLILKETRGVPLEEMAKIWGDADDVAVFSSQIDLSAIEAEGMRRQQPV